MKLNYTLIILFLFLSCSSLNAQWIKTNGPGPHFPIFAMANTNSVVFASQSVDGVCSTSNNGQNWIYTLPTGGSITYGIATDGAVIFVGTTKGPFSGSDYTIWRSNDFGQIWLNLTSFRKNVHAIAIGGTNVFAGTDSTVYISNNYGQTWTPTSLNPKYIYSLAATSTNVFAGTYSYGLYDVFLSTNNGQNWITSLSGPQINSIVISGTKVYAGGNGLYLSTNLGQNWSSISSFSEYVNSVAVLDTNIFAAVNNLGVYLSTNNGQIWNQWNDGLTKFNVLSLTIANGYVFVANDSVWRRSVSDICTWVPNQPNLSTPSNNSQNQPTTIQLVWYKSQYAGSYKVQLSTDSLFTNLVVNDSTITDSTKTVTGLLYQQKYYWRVYAKNLTGYSSPSSLWNFTTTPIPPAQINLSVIPGGFYNGSGCLNKKDTIKIILVDSATCNKIDSVKVLIDSLTFAASPTPSFSKANTGDYYIIVYHRNHIPISSAHPVAVTRGSTVSYDFTSDSTKTYAKNVIKVSTSPVKWGMIPADANQDGYADALDQIVWIVQNGLGGYLAADFNGDGYVDGLDQTLWIINNGKGFYSPCSFLENNLNYKWDNGYQKIIKILNENK